jgi:hypothetical protein
VRNGGWRVAAGFSVGVVPRSSVLPAVRTHYHPAWSRIDVEYWIDISFPLSDLIKFTVPPLTHRRKSDNSLIHPPCRFGQYPRTLRRLKCS